MGKTSWSSSLWDKTPQTDSKNHVLTIKSKDAVSIILDTWGLILKGTDNGYTDKSPESVDE